MFIFQVREKPTDLPDISPNEWKAKNGLEFRHKAKCQNKMARFNGKLVVILWKDNLWCSALLLNELFAS